MKAYVKPNDLEHLIYAAQGKCFYCGESFEQSMDYRAISKTMTIDHKTPVTKGGGFELSNLVACCFSCNGKKRSMKFEEYRFKLACKSFKGGDCWAYYNTLLTAFEIAPSAHKAVIQELIDAVVDKVSAINFQFPGELAVCCDRSTEAAR
jgi:hypothetical protein